MFGVKVTSCNTHCPHFLKHMSRYYLSNVDLGMSTHLFFFLIVSHLYAVNKEVLFQALASNLQSVYFDLFYFGLGI